MYFITCSCCRLPCWAPPADRDLLLNLLEEVRRSHRFVVLGYVVLPERFHLLISEPQQTPPSVVMQVLKRRFAHPVLSQSRMAQCGGQSSLWVEVAGEIWQRSFYDFNVWTERKPIEKPHYMHRNPVKRGWSRSPSSGRGAAFARTPSQKWGGTDHDCQVLEMKIRPPAA